MEPPEWGDGAGCERKMLGEEYKSQTIISFMVSEVYCTRFHVDTSVFFLYTP